MAAFLSAQQGGSGDGYAVGVKTGDRRRPGGVAGGRVPLNSVTVCPMCGYAPEYGSVALMTIHADGERYVWDLIDKCRVRGTHFHRCCLRCSARWLEWPA